MEYLKPEQPRSWSGILMGMLLIMAMVLSGRAAEPPTIAKNPYDLMAGFLKNFPAYVEWPVRAAIPSVTGSNAVPANAVPTNVIPTNVPPWRIGVLGEDPFDGALAVAVKNRQIKGRSFEIFQAITLDQLPSCDIVYLASRDVKVLEEQLAYLQSKPVLTVGSDEDFLKLGGIVQMKTVGVKMRFDVDVDHARRAGLKIDVQMLVGARHVIQDGKKIK